MQALSDLHLEFHADGGESYLRSLICVDDVLVVAGDLHAGAGVLPVLHVLCRKFETVIYVPGNHEFYGSSFPEFRRILGKAALQSRNLVVLDNSVANVAGRRFVGTTLWFPDGPFNAVAAPYLNDFGCIEDFGGSVYAENASAVAFLDRQLEPGDVVVTHHLPLPESVHPRFARNVLHPFFLCDVSRLIREREPAIWIHGHTHLSFDYLYGATRVVCNPAGYPYDPNPDFQAGLVL